MSNPRYPEEFKTQAVNQVTEKKLPVADVAARLGVSTHSLYAWIKRYSKPQEERQQDDDQHAELRRLRAALKRVTEERDILKKGRPPLVKASGTKTLQHVEVAHPVDLPLRTLPRVHLTKAHLLPSGGSTSSDFAFSFVYGNRKVAR